MLWDRTFPGRLCVLRHMPCSLGWQCTRAASEDAFVICTSHIFPSSRCLQSLVCCLCWERSQKELLTPADSSPQPETPSSSFASLKFSVLDELYGPPVLTRQKMAFGAAFFHSLHLQLQMRTVLSLPVCTLHVRKEIGFLGCGGEPLAPAWAGKVQDDNLQQFNPALAVPGALGMGESVIWLHRGLIALHLSNLISCRHLPAPELLFCIPNPSDLKQRTEFYFAGLLHHLNWSWKCLKQFCTNFLC